MIVLYVQLMWLEEDKVLEVKYVRHAPRLYSRTDGDIAQQSVKADGALRFYLGRLHVVLLYKILSDLHVRIQLCRYLICKVVANSFPHGN